MIRLNINPEKPEKEIQNPAKESGSERERNLYQQFAQLSKEELLEKFLEAEKRYLYLRADFENYKRNVEKERAEMSEKGKEEVLSDLFGILELLERAIESARRQDIDSSVLEGLELVRKQAEKILQKHQIERIPTLGEKFNPEVHEAIGVQPAQDCEPGTILFEYEPGFIRQGKLLKPAKVVVAKESSPDQN